MVGIEEAVVDIARMKCDGGVGQHLCAPSIIDNLAGQITDLVPDPGKLGDQPGSHRPAWAGSSFPVLIHFDDIAELHQTTLFFDLRTEAGLGSACVAFEHHGAGMAILQHARDHTEGLTGYVPSERATQLARLSPPRFATFIRDVIERCYAVGLGRCRRRHLLGEPAAFLREVIQIFRRLVSRKLAVTCSPD